MAKSKRNTVLAAAAQRAKAPIDVPSPANVAPTPTVENSAVSVLSNRQSLLRDINDGRREEVLHRYVDPTTCRMWRRHNREYDRLTPEICDDLISTIADVGQKTPAIVRKLRNDKDGFEYEVICGARRHFAVTHLRDELGRSDLFYKVEVHDISDEEAFHWSDLENRARVDISDYERGKDYLTALEEFYEGNIRAMAQKLGFKRQALSNYFYLARLPEVVVHAYHDPFHIAVRHAAKLWPMLQKDDQKQTILNRAQNIAVEQEQSMRVGNVLAYDGATVFKLLTEPGRGAAASVGKKEKPRQIVRDAGGTALFTIEESSRHVVLRIPKRRAASKKELIEAIRANVE
ncbi:MAG: ParB/RepB/Spo0J family partition protein [Pseudomonadota bacterium]